MKLRPRSSKFALMAMPSVMAVSVASADSIYMHIPGVTGPVTAAGYEGDIEILAYSQGFSSNGTSVLCSDTSISKNLDTTSQFFSRNVLEQSGPFTATIYFVNPATLVADTTIAMKSVTVTSIQHSGAEGGGSFSESISLKTPTITVTYNGGTTKQSYTATCP